MIGTDTERANSRFYDVYDGIINEYSASIDKTPLRVDGTVAYYAAFAVRSFERRLAPYTRFHSIEDGNLRNVLTNYVAGIFAVEEEQCSALARDFAALANTAPPKLLWTMIADKVKQDKTRSACEERSNDRRTTVSLEGALLRA